MEKKKNQRDDNTKREVFHIASLLLLSASRPRPFVSLKKFFFLFLNEFVERRLDGSACF